MIKVLLAIVMCALRKPVVRKKEGAEHGHNG